ncbi:hypothetical protein ACFTAO_27510 [Paenibacillus rhizoplanae]
MIQNEQNAKAAINELRSDNRGMIRLGVLPSDLDYRLTPMLVKFHADFSKYPAPGLRFNAYSTGGAGEQAGHRHLPSRSA